MALKIETGEFQQKRTEGHKVDPRALVVNWADNHSRGGEMPPDDDIEMMVQSLLTHGQQQTISCKRLPDKRLKVVFGYCRAEAARRILERNLAHEFLLDVKIVDINDKEEIIRNIVENEDRIQTKPIQTARALRKLNEELAMTPDEISKAFGKSISWVLNYFKLNTLPHEIQEAVKKEETTVTAAHELAKMDGDKAKEIHRDLKTENQGKPITARQVKERKRNTGEPVPRTFKQVRDCFEVMEKLENASGAALAAYLVSWVKGEISDDKMLEAWKLVFPDDREIDFS